MKDGRRTAVENEDDREGAAEEPADAADAQVGRPVEAVRVGLDVLEHEGGRAQRRALGARVAQPPAATARLGVTQV